MEVRSGGDEEEQSVSCDGAAEGTANFVMKLRLLPVLDVLHVLLIEKVKREPLWWSGPQPAATEVVPNLTMENLSARPRNGADEGLR